FGRLRLRYPVPGAVRALRLPARRHTRPRALLRGGVEHQLPAERALRPLDARGAGPVPPAPPPAPPPPPPPPPPPLPSPTPARPGLGGGAGARAAAAPRPRDRRGAPRSGRGPGRASRPREGRRSRGRGGPPPSTAPCRRPRLALRSAFRGRRRENRRSSSPTR